MPDVPGVDVLRMPYGSELKSILKGLRYISFLVLYEAIYSI